MKIKNTLPQKEQVDIKFNLLFHIIKLNLIC